MDSSTYDRLQAIVMQATELEPALRGPFLVEQCAGSDGLLREAERLLPLVAESEGAYSDEVVEARRSELESIFDAEDEAARSDAWIPERIGQYEVRGIIGRGGSGVVFEAHQLTPKRSVALKLLHPSLATPESMGRIAKEADALARLQHPGIAQIFEAGTFDAGAGEQPFIAMELIDGYSLAEHAHHAELSRGERAGLLAKVCDAVQHAHERGVVHRDLKPENVLVDASGQPKLLDFGIARIAREHSLSIEALTAEGQLLGTAAYMAPEQAQGGAVESSASGAAVDVFALGAVGFELFAGRKPRDLEGLTMTQMMHEVATADIARLRTVDPAIDVDVETIVGKACDTEPSRRYGSAAALGSDLRRWLENRPISARPPTAWYRATKFVRRHRVLAFGVSATVAALILGLVVSAYLAAVARDAVGATQRKLYAAEMLVATGASMDPATRIRSAKLTEHWADSSALVGWEWHLLDAVRRRDVVPLDLPGYPMDVDWHPGGDKVAVVMEESVGVFDAATGELIATRSFLDDLPNCYLTGLRWNEPGTQLAISAELRVFLWEPPRGPDQSDDEGTLLWTAEMEFAPDLCWHPDGERIFSIGHRVIGLDARTGDVVFDEAPGPWGISGDVFSSSGDRVAFARSRDHALVYDFPSLKPVLESEERLPVLSRVTWSPDDRLLAASGTDHALRVYDTKEGRLLFTNREHSEAVFGVDWHPSGETLAVSAADGTVRVVDGQSGRTLETYLRHETRVGGVRWSPDGKRLATVAVSGEALVWTASELSAFRIHSDPRLASATTDLRLQWEPKAGRLLAGKRGSAISVDPRGAAGTEAMEFIGRVSLSTDRDWRATSRGGPEFQIVRRSTGEVALSENLSDDGFLMHDWVAGEDTVIAGCKDGLWRFEVDSSGAVRSKRMAEISGQVSHLRCGPRGDRVGFLHSGVQLSVADAQSGEPLSAVSAPGRVGFNAFCWSPDGGQIALACSDGALRVADAATGGIFSTLLGHTNQVECVHWHPSMPRIATGGRDRTVKLWNSGSGELTALFRCRAAVADVQWILGGRALAAIDTAGNVYTWDATRSLDASAEVSESE